MESADFGEWLQFLFAHPPHAAGTWYIEEEPAAVLWTGPPERLHAFVLQLFRDPAVAFDRFPRDEVAEGLWFIASDVSGYAEILLAPSRSTESKVEVVRSVLDLFRDGFAPRCTNALAHQSGGNCLDMTAYMWWDLFGPPADGLDDELQAATIDVLARILALPSTTCQKAALHGLGHWHDRAPEQTTTLITRALHAGTLDPRLEAYALRAARGAVL